jgi:predicted HTH transcriptional regulator
MSSISAYSQAGAGDLLTLKLATNYQARVVPTIGGVLLFRVDRLSHYPDAWIQAGRFAGKDRRRILDVETAAKEVSLRSIGFRFLSTLATFSSIVIQSQL